MIIVCTLATRTIVLLNGIDTIAFLNRVITRDVPEVGGNCYAALLTPQGKVETDFFVWRVGENECAIDVSTKSATVLTAILNRYRLRSKIEIATTDKWRSAVLWYQHSNSGIDTSDDTINIENYVTPCPAELMYGPDPRSKKLGWRVLYHNAHQASIDALAERINPTASSASNASEQVAAEEQYRYNRFRIGITEAGEDCTAATHFPRDLGLFELGGIEFDKGCYVGQEVVSRVYHRSQAKLSETETNPATSEARRGLVLSRINVDSGLSVGETLFHVAADGKKRKLGEVYAICGDLALLMLRIDRISQTDSTAMDSATSISCQNADGVSVNLMPERYDEVAGNDA